MEYFRKFLTFLRKGYNTKGKKYFQLWGSLLLVSLIAGVLVDIFVPFGAWWNLIRTAILVPLSVSIFAVGYAISLTLHRMKSSDSSWRPYRTRFSPLWRIRISAIVGTIAFVLIYASGESPIFTLFSSAMLAVGIALVAFMRKTSQEQKRETLGIPDARDVSYDSELRRLQDNRRDIISKRAAKRAEKNQGKQSFKAFRPLASQKPEDDS